MIEILKLGDEKLNKILKRSQLDMTENASIVKEIVQDVKQNGDSALFAYTKKFDKIDLTSASLKVTEQEIDEAFETVDKKLIEVMQRSAENIRNYHKKLVPKTWTSVENGKMLGQLIQPISALGIYVPGGAAAYPSSVLMSAIPAQVAGVENIAIATPCNISSGKIANSTLAAAKIAGIKTIYKMGGAQAIAAFAFGTETVTKVDKIVGPGNIFVALAKREVFGYVGIDSIAGPSEVLVIADNTANASYVAADLLSQAEHDKLAACICITDSIELTKAINAEIEKQTAVLERKEIIESALKDFGAIVLVKDMKEAIELANTIAPEHLELCVENPESLLPFIKNAGAIFLGNYSPEPLGDYYAGPSHVLPTSGTARFFSPLGIDDFIKKSSLIKYSREALEAAHTDIEAFAHSEGLTAHENSIKIRFK